jgi:hypothetical protein
MTALFYVAKRPKEMIDSYAKLASLAVNFVSSRGGLLAALF